LGLQLSQQPEADALLDRDPLALLIGMVLDQQIPLVALLGKQLGVTPPGWREAADPYGEPGSLRSVADITDQTSLEQVRAAKAAARQGG